MSGSVVVTGATGFLGSALCRRLKTLGYDVTALGRNAVVGAQLRQMGITFHQCDINDVDKLETFVKQNSTIVHCAALSSVWGKRTQFNQVNVQGTETIAKVAIRKQAQKLVHISSPSVYCTTDDHFNLSEEHPLPKNQLNDYARSKFKAEQVLNSYTEKLPITILRPHAIFGIGDTAIFPRLLRANSTRGIPLINEGRALIDFTHVDNVVAAILCAIQTQTPSGRIFNITNGESQEFRKTMEYLFNAIDRPIRWLPLSFRTAMAFATTAELFSTISLSGNEPILTRYGVCAISKSRTFNIDRAKIELNYKPTKTIADGLDEFAAYIKQQTT